MCRKSWNRQITFAVLRALSQVTFERCIGYVGGRERSGGDAQQTCILFKPIPIKRAIVTPIQSNCCRFPKGHLGTTVLTRVSGMQFVALLVGVDYRSLIYA